MSNTSTFKIKKEIKPEEVDTEEYRNLFNALPSFEILDQFLLLENEQED